MFSLNMHKINIKQLLKYSNLYNNTFFWVKNRYPTLKKKLDIAHTFLDKLYKIILNKLTVSNLNNALFRDN
jgi:hypothetical protein